MSPAACGHWLKNNSWRRACVCPPKESWQPSLASRATRCAKRWRSWWAKDCCSAVAAAAPSCAGSMKVGLSRILCSRWKRCWPTIRTTALISSKRATPLKPAPPGMPRCARPMPIKKKSAFALKPPRATTRTSPLRPTFASISPLPRHPTTWCCCKPCAVFLTCCNRRWSKAANVCIWCRRCLRSWPSSIWPFSMPLPPVMPKARVRRWWRTSVSSTPPLNVLMKTWLARRGSPACPTTTLIFPGRKKHDYFRCEWLSRRRPAHSATVPVPLYWRWRVCGTHPAPQCGRSLRRRAAPACAEKYVRPEPGNHAV